MAVVRVTAIDQFVGVSADVKPTDCRPGSTFFETDTGDLYVFDGSDWWAQ